MEEFMLTTRDNDCDPFENFDEWLKEDRRLGHNCCGVQAMIANTSYDLSDEDNIEITNKAIDEFVTQMCLINCQLLETNSKLKEEDLTWYKIARRNIGA